MLRQEVLESFEKGKIVELQENMSQEWFDFIQKENKKLIVPVHLEEVFQSNNYSVMKYIERVDREDTVILFKGFQSLSEEDKYNASKLIETILNTSKLTKILVYNKKGNKRIEDYNERLKGKVFIVSKGEIL